MISRKYFSSSTNKICCCLAGCDTMDSGFWIQGFRRLLTISPGSLPTAARKNKLQAGHCQGRRILTRIPKRAVAGNSRDGAALSSLSHFGIRVKPEACRPNELPRRPGRPGARPCLRSRGRNILRCQSPSVWDNPRPGWAFGAVASASRLHRVGRGFESLNAHHSFHAHPWSPSMSSAGRPGAGWV